MSALTPQAAFTWTLAGLALTVDATPSRLTEPADHLRWAWGDGTESLAGLLDLTARHEYAEAGTYAVRLDVLAGGAVASSVEYVLTVTADPEPTPPTVDLDLWARGRSLTATARAAEGSASIGGYSWRIGDLAVTTTRPHIAWTLPEAGTVAVTVTAHDLAGQTATASGSIDLTEPPTPATLAQALTVTLDGRDVTASTVAVTVHEADEHAVPEGAPEGAEPVWTPDVGTVSVARWQAGDSPHRGWPLTVALGGQTIAAGTVSAVRVAVRPEAGGYVRSDTLEATIPARTAAPADPPPGGRPLLSDRLVAPRWAYVDYAPADDGGPVTVRVNGRHHPDALTSAPMGGLVDVEHDGGAWTGRVVGRTLTLDTRANLTLDLDLVPVETP